MTLQEQIDFLKNGRYTASKPLSLEIIHKQSEMLKVAKEALSRYSEEDYNGYNGNGNCAKYALATIEVQTANIEVIHNANDDDIEFKFIMDFVADIQEMVDFFNHFSKAVDDKIIDDLKPHFKAIEERITAFPVDNIFEEMAKCDKIPMT